MRRKVDKETPKFWSQKPFCILVAFFGQCIQLVPQVSMQKVAPNPKKLEPSRIKRAILSTKKNKKNRKNTGNRKKMRQWKKILKPGTNFRSNELVI